MRSDIRRLELMARVGGVYLDTDINPVRPLDACCPPGVPAWVACEQGHIISNAAMGFVPNHPAAWRAVNAIEESFFERRNVGEQAGPGLVARILLEHDDVVCWPPACFHPTVAEVARNPDRSRLLMQAHLFAGTWVEGRRSSHLEIWKPNTCRIRQPTALHPSESLHPESAWPQRASSPLRKAERTPGALVPRRKEGRCGR